MVFDNFVTVPLIPGRKQTARVQNPKRSKTAPKAAFMKAHLSKRNSKKSAIILASLCLAACVNWTDPIAMQTRQTADLCQAYFLVTTQVA
jgi:hypothetical protein